MKQPWQNNNCAALKTHFSVYSIPKAAALWCGVPEDQVDEIVKEAKQLSSTGFGRSIWTHPCVPCLEPNSRAIAEAIENGTLPHGREDGRTVPEGSVAHERRHFFGRDLKIWMEQAFPNEKPAFLFDDIERNSHTAISADAYRALLADRDALQKRIDKATEVYKSLREEKESISKDRDDLKTEVEKLKDALKDSAPPGERSETTYQNIIAALLDCIAGNLPEIVKHPSFSSEAKLIDAIDEHYRGYSGLSKSNLSRKFPEAKQKLKSQ